MVDGGSIPPTGVRSVKMDHENLNENTSFTTSEDVELLSVSEETSEGISEISSEETSLTDDNESYELICQCNYSPDDLVLIHDDLTSIYTALQIIACILVVLVLFKVLALGRTLIDAIF